MPFAPPPVPSTFRLGPVRVGNPVSAYHGARYVSDLAELLATNSQTFVDTAFDCNYGGGAASASAFFSRSPGCQALLVGVELQPIDGARATVTVTNNGAALTWIQANGLDGASPLLAPPAGTVTPQVHYGVVDVSGLLTDGTVYRLNVAVATSTGALLDRVFVRELPLAQVAPESAPTTEVAANAAWPFYRPGPSDRTAGLVDGATTLDRGFVRVHDQLEQGRTRWRTWRQWTWLELDAYAPQTTSTTLGNLTFANGGSYNPAWVTRARRLYATTVGSATETARVVVRYKCTDASGGTIRLVVDGANADFAVANAAAYTTATLGTVTLKPGAADQRSTIGLQGKVAASGTLYVPTVALHPLET